MLNATTVNKLMDAFRDDARAWLESLPASSSSGDKDSFRADATSISGRLPLRCVARAFYGDEMAEEVNHQQEKKQ